MNDSSSSTDVAQLAFACLAMGLLIRFFWGMIGDQFDPALDLVWRGWRVFELYIWQLVSYPLHLFGVGPQPEQIAQQIEWLISRPYGSVIDDSVRDELTHNWGSWWAPVVATLFCLLAFRHFRSSWVGSMDTSMEGMIKRVAKVNPRIARYVKENPMDYPVEYRPFKDNRYAQRVTPWDFARMSPPPGADVSDDESLRTAGAIFDPERPQKKRFNAQLAEQVLTLQLGNRTCGKETWKRMSATERKVYKACAKRIFKGATQVNRIVERHAYIRTALMELYHSSTLTTNEIPWLKYEDRTLWYCLQDTGQEVCSAEAAGPFAHWTCERETGKPIPVPAVELAVLGLANLFDIPDKQLESYLKEDDDFRSRPNYWESMRDEAVKARATSESNTASTRKSKKAPAKTRRKSSGK